MGISRPNGHPDRDRDGNNSPPKLQTRDNRHDVHRLLGVEGHRSKISNVHGDGNVMSTLSICALHNYPYWWLVGNKGMESRNHAYVIYSLIPYYPLGSTPSYNKPTPTYHSPCYGEPQSGTILANPHKALCYTDP